MDSGGGAVVVASGSEIANSTIGSATTQYRKWFRLYSDGWCEQGGLCIDDIKEELPIPYEDTYFQIQLTTCSTTPSAFVAYPWWHDSDQSFTTYHSFTPRQGTDRQGGPAIWGSYVARGYVSQEAFRNVLAGKEWDPVTESWGGEYLVNIETGSRELTLEPGRYKVYMVGKGGSGTYAYGDYGYWASTGSAGASIIADIKIPTSSTAVIDLVIDSSGNSKLSLDGSLLLTSGAGADASYSGTPAGGTNTVIQDSRITINVNEPGEAGTYAAYLTGGPGRVYSFLARHHIISGYNGCSCDNQGTSGISSPGPALIMLYKYED